MCRGAISKYVGGSLMQNTLPHEIAIFFYFYLYLYLYHHSDQRSQRSSVRISLYDPNSKWLLSVKCF